jgi:hypothetical protein
MMLQLDPPIPVITIKGKGMAHVIIDYSQEHDLMWVVFQDDTGECWTWRNADVRGQGNATLGRPEPAVSANKQFLNMLLKQD